MLINRIVWSDVAKQSLNTTTTFLIDKWGKSISNSFLTTIDTRLNSLILNPHLGASINKKHFRRILIHKHISLFYHIKGNDLVVLLIWDNRQSSKELKQKLYL